MWLHDAKDVFELLAVAGRTEEAAKILLRLLAGHARLPLPACPELDDIISRNFSREEYRAVSHILLEQAELIFQLPASLGAQSLALFRQDVRLNLVSDSRFLRLVWSGQGDAASPELRRRSSSRAFSSAVPNDRV